MIRKIIHTIWRRTTLRTLLLFGAVVSAYSGPLGLKEAPLPQLASWKNVNAAAYRLNHESGGSFRSDGGYATSFRSAPANVSFKVWTSTSQNSGYQSSGWREDYYTPLSYSHKSSQDGINSSSSLSFSPASLVEIRSSAPRSLSQVTVSIETAEEDLYPGVKNGTDIDGLHIGELTPIGDGIGVLLFLIASYVIAHFFISLKKTGTTKK